MTARVLDTSVAIAWYLPEIFSEQARGWRERLLDGKARLIVPSLHFWEFANVLRTYVRRGELDRELALETYETHLEAPLERLEPDPARVLQTALRFESTAYDAVFISLALQYQVPLLTAERTTAPWVTRLGKQADVIRADGR